MTHCVYMVDHHWDQPHRSSISSSDGRHTYHSGSAALLNFLLNTTCLRYLPSSLSTQQMAKALISTSTSKHWPGSASAPYPETAWVRYRRVTQYSPVCANGICLPSGSLAYSHSIQHEYKESLEQFRTKIRLCQVQVKEQLTWGSESFSNIVGVHLNPPRT